MKSIRRCQHVITVFLFIFIAGMVTLVVKINKEASFYMMNSDKHELGMVYDRNGDVLFDGLGQGQYEDGHFLDVGNLIGDDKGQMNNTLVAQNIDLLNNYSFSAGLVKDGGKASIHTTLDHAANRTVYNAYQGAKGCAVAYNYKTGEILVCTSLPNIDVTRGYDNIADMESGTLISKAMCGTVPGSTQKVSTVISALEIMGQEKLFSKRYTCNGQFVNREGKPIDCHQSEYIDIDGIQCDKASTTLTDSGDFNTQWGCIGQGDTLVSPVQLMMWESAIANGNGKMTMPHLISKVTDVYGDVSEVRGTSFSNQLFSSSTASTVKQILITNGANNYSGSIPGYTLGIKSGTAQVKNGDEENALLVGFVDDSAHPIAFCVLLENKYSTPVSAEQIAKTMLDALCS